MSSEPSAVQALPRGRHGLSRETVEASQRTRLMRAVIELGADGGFESLTLSDIVGRAGVARRTFYEHFANKEACCMAAYDYAAAQLVEQLAAARRPEVEPLRGRIERYVTALLDLAMHQPSTIRMFTADAGGAGPAAGAHQRNMRRRIADGLVGLSAAQHELDPSSPALTRVRALAIVGAVNELIQQTFHERGARALRELEPELCDIALALYSQPGSRK
jgi:AcrR family transcriptional regulator